MLLARHPFHRTASPTTTNYDIFFAEYMFIVGDHSYSYYPEIVSLREGGEIPDCLTDLSDPFPPRTWFSSAGGALPEAGKMSLNT